MKLVLIILLLLPSLALCQKWEYEGVYSIVDTPGKKIRLRAGDTINEVFTFTADSFKYAYAVMRPNTNKIVSVDYVEYGTLKLTTDTILTTMDKTSGTEFPFERFYATVDDGKKDGFFEPAYVAFSDFTPSGIKQPAFLRNNKVFIRTSAKVARPLLR